MTSRGVPRGKATGSYATRLEERRSLHGLISPRKPILQPDPLDKEYNYPGYNSNHQKMKL